jgi:hypothetical protein
VNGAPIAAVRVVTAPPPAPEARLLAPLGIACSLGSAAGLGVENGAIVATVGELGTGQQAALIAPDAEGPVVLTWRYAAAPEAPRYPEAAFSPRRSRWTDAADDLARASRAIAAAAGGGADGIAARGAGGRGAGPLHLWPSGGAVHRRTRRRALPRLRRRRGLLRRHQHLFHREPARGGL